MVREQEPPRLPLSASKANMLPPSPDSQQHEKPVPLHIPPRNNALSQLQFGKPTSMGLPPQSNLYPQLPPQVANSSQPRSVSGTRDPGHSNLFISSKSGAPRPELHKPPQTTNTLQQAMQHAMQGVKKVVQDNAAPRLGPQYGHHAHLAPAGQQAHHTGEVIEIPRSTYWEPPKPSPFPMYSSSSYSNESYRPRNNFVDLTTSTVGVATNATLFDDRYAGSDPSTYIDAGKANEEIKALLEGALEDEEDMPRTRRRKKQQEQKAEALTEHMQGMSIKADEESDEEEDDGTIEGLKVKLLPHQIDGVTWMQDKEIGSKKTGGALPKGGILADDMGLGKTIQALALMLTNPKPTAGSPEAAKRKLSDKLDKGTLVVAPLALIKQWEGEIKDRVEDTHTLKVRVHHGPQRTKNYKDLKKYDVVITTFQTLASEHASSEGSLKVGCYGLNWYRVILDEAHSIKNRNAKATKAACALEAEYRWCLTGTPMQNNLDELQSLIHFLRIRPFQDLNEWREQITKPMNNGRGGLAIKRLRIYLKVFMKRRTKEVLKQDGALKVGTKGKSNDPKANGFKIVQRVVENVEAEFTPDERIFYDRLETRADERLERMMASNKVNYANALVLLLRLRQACNHPKLIQSDLTMEKDNFQNTQGSQTPSRRKPVEADDLDSITNMLGGLSVETKTCDVCQVELSAREVSNGAIRCIDCEADIGAQEARSKAQKEEKRAAKKAKRAKEAQARRKQNRRVVADSDEEDERVAMNNEPENEEDVKPSRRIKKEFVNLVSSDVEADKSSDEEEDEAEDESDSDSSYDSSDPSQASNDLITSTKIRHLLSILRTDCHQHKYIVFSFFTSMLDLIEPFLKHHHLRYVRYDGQMRNDAREAALASLRNDSHTRVLLCSLRAGSLGLNLTAASRVVILEPFWNPFVEEQAIDRVHRLNQTQDVKVFKLTVRDTVESRILDLQDKKRELAEKTLEGKMGVGKLTMQDVLKLFRRDAEHEHRVDGVGMREKGSLLREGERIDRSRVGAGAQKPLRKEHEIYGRRW